MSDGTDDVAELRRRLDMAEDELTFLKAVFEEYKDSSGELEAELDAQLKDLERSNMALKRENEQIRAQLQSTVTRSRKSAEEASNLTTALEAHLEELTKREKKAQSQIRLLEQENEQLKDQVSQASQASEAAESNKGAGSVPDEVVEKLRADLEAARGSRSEMDKKLGDTRSNLHDVRVRAAKLAQLTESRFATDEGQIQIPELPPDYDNDLDAINHDITDVAGILGKTEALMADTGMAVSLLREVDGLLTGNQTGVTLEGRSELALNRSSLLVIGKILLLGSSLPEFTIKVEKLKTSIAGFLGSETKEDAQAFELAHQVVTLTQNLMTSVFDPLVDQPDKEKELENLEALAREKEQALKAELAKQRQEFEAEIRSARTEANAKAEEARRQALAESAVSRKDIEEEIYKSVATEMDELRGALEKEQAKYKQATMTSKMYQESMKKAIIEKSQQMMDAMKNARDELETLKRSSQVELADTQKLLNENLTHVRKVARTIAKSDVAQLSMMYERELDMRVKLQDQVQSLKGNIRVFCRIRPLLGREIEDGEMEAVAQTDEMTVTAEDPEQGKPHSFAFDRVFGPQDTQEIVFDEMRTLCLSALDGYNVCLFAYGITGSGKTFTVEGGDDARDNPKLQGLVFRTIREIFRIVNGERSGAYETNVGIQLMELYNEEFRDLLGEPGAPKPEVRLIPDVGVQVDNVTVLPATQVADAMAVVSSGYRNRTVRSTNSNNVSSRSHSILTLHLNGMNLRTKKNYTGKLHFVDLAGSERVGKSGVQGEALKEAQAINKSLSALGDVIQALSKKEKFVPFRNSQLTKLLQESLGGNSKTVMISNISPCKHSMAETVNSLRFATRAHSVEMGKASKNENSDGAEVKQIKNKMADLESKFKSRGAGGKSATDAGGKMKPPTTPRSKSTSISKDKSPRASKGRK